MYCYIMSAYIIYDITANQYLILKVSEQHIESQQKLENFHAAISGSIPLSMQREMKNSAFIYSFSKDPSVKRRS